MTFLDPTATQISGVGGGHLTGPRPCHGSSSWGSVQEPWPGAANSFSARAFSGAEKIQQCKVMEVIVAQSHMLHVLYIYPHLGRVKMLVNVPNIEHVRMFCCDKKESNQQKMESNRSAIPAT